MRTISLLILVSTVVGINSAAAQPIEQTSSVFLSKIAKKNPPPARKKTQTEEQPLDFSDTGRPGQQTAGESRGSCASLDAPIEAVIPVSHSGKTTLAHPSFWVYFPYSTISSHRVEFILQDESREDIWRSQPQPLNRDRGYQRFSLPTQAPPLKEEVWYRWYVKVYCGSQTASAQYVQGWVKRVPLSSRLYVTLQNQQPQSQIYATHGIWYDAVDSILNVEQNQPGNLNLERDWRNLIEAKGVKLENLPGINSIYEAVK